ncbi:MAG: arginine--tRNA ligase [Candidatus Micrarchaeia archaeon]
MKDPFLHAKEEVVKLVEESCKKLKFQVSKEEIERSLEYPKEQFGDLASAVCFELAKREKKAPRAIAEKIKDSIRKSELVERVEVAGAGYLNFYFNYEKFAKLTVEAVEKNKKYGEVDFGKGRKALVEFPSVNPNKPWHIGHLRNALLGDSVARILEFAGYKVERENYIDDLGLQVAQSVWGYMKLNNKVEGKVDHWLGKQYVEVAKRSGEEEVEREVREIMKKLEEGGNEISKLGRELAERCVKAQYETAFKLNVYQDVLIWESDIVRTRILEDAIEMLVKKGAAVRESEGENAGCIVAKLEGMREFVDMENPDKILIRSDGTATYTGKDVAFQMWKFGILPNRFKFSVFMKQPNAKMLYTTSSKGKRMGFGKADLVVNVIGVEQRYPQKVLTSLLRRMGYEKEADNSVHLSYEHAWLPDERFSGREGTWVGYTADELVEKAVEYAKGEIKNRFREMGEKEKEEIAKAVGVGGVRFDFLRMSPEKKIVFRWEEALNFEGDSAPYIQYSHARAARIIEKAPKGKGAVDYSVLTSPDERRLVKLIAKFPSVVRSAARDCRPHYVADYLIDLATAFSKFYTTCPVLTAPEKERAARLALVRCTKRVLRNGLELLGIEAVERM